MTIYDQLGGTAAVSIAVDKFYDRVTADPSLSSYFESIELNKLKGHMRAFLGAALGGTEPYLGRDMQSAHANLAITSVAFDSVVAHLIGVLADLGVESSIIEEIGIVLAPLKAVIVDNAAVPQP